MPSPPGQRRQLVLASKRPRGQARARLQLAWQRATQSPQLLPLLPQLLLLENLLEPWHLENLILFVVS
jgi:hypothetical protein